MAILRKQAAHSGALKSASTRSVPMCLWVRISRAPAIRARWSAVRTIRQLSIFRSTTRWWRSATIRLKTGFRFWDRRRSPFAAALEQRPQLSRRAGAASSWPWARAAPWKMSGWARSAVIVRTVRLHGWSRCRFRFIPPAPLISDLPDFIDTIENSPAALDDQDRRRQLFQIYAGWTGRRRVRPRHRYRDYAMG